MNFEIILQKHKILDKLIFLGQLNLEFSIKDVFKK